MRETSYGKIDALAETGELSVPLVVLKNDIKNSSSRFIGFIPGFLMKNIISNEKEECMLKLKTFLKKKLKVMMKNNEPFPFFPSKQEILKEYDNVELIEFIKIKSESRKNS